MYIPKYYYKSLSLVLKYEFKRLFFKSIFLNTIFTPQIRAKALKKLILLSRRTSSSYLKLRCVSSLQTRSVLTMFKLSRIRFRNIFSLGGLPGLRKGSR